MGGPRHTAHCVPGESLTGVLANRNPNVSCPLDMQQEWWAIPQSLLLLLEQVVLGLPNVTFILFFRRHSFLSCIQNSTFNLIGRSRETYLPASHNIISLLGGSPVWTTLLPALFSCSILSCNFFQRNGHPSPVCLRWFCTVASPLAGLRACWARDSWDH